MTGPEWKVIRTELVAKWPQWARVLTDPQTEAIWIRELSSYTPEDIHRGIKAFSRFKGERTLPQLLKFIEAPKRGGPALPAIDPNADPVPAMRSGFAAYRDEALAEIRNTARIQGWDADLLLRTEEDFLARCRARHPNLRELFVGKVSEQDAHAAIALADAWELDRKSVTRDALTEGMRLALRLELLRRRTTKKNREQHEGEVA